MLDATGHDEELPSAQLDVLAVARAQHEPAADDEEELVGIVVVVPDGLALQLREPTRVRRGAARAVAVVTGGSRGAGRAIASVLGESGMTVYVTGRSTRARGTTEGLPGTIEDTAEEVTRRGGHGVPVACDHTVDADVEALFARVGAEQGRLDLLVSNAWGGYERYDGATSTRRCGSSRSRAGTGCSRPACGTTSPRRGRPRRSCSRAAAASS